MNGVNPIVIFLCSLHVRWASWTLIGFEVSNCSNIVILRSAITRPVPQPYQLITLVINSTRMLNNSLALFLYLRLATDLQVRAAANAGREHSSTEKVIETFPALTLTRTQRQKQSDNFGDIYLMEKYFEKVSHR